MLGFLDDASNTPLPWWGTVLIAFVPLIGAILVFLSAKRVNDTQDRRVDGEAYERAERLYQNMLQKSQEAETRQQDQMRALNEHIIEQQRQLNDAQRVTHDLQRSVTQLQQEVARYQSRVRDLEDVIKDAKLDLPPE